MHCDLYLLDSRPLAGQEARWLPLLTDERRARVERCRPPEEKLTLAAAGLLLRHVLHVTDDAQLQAGPHGKLFLAAGGPHFNLSHSAHYVVLAVGDGPLGVDIEPIGEKMPIRIPRRFLLPDEIAWLEQEPTGARFAWLWTRLEAVLKADGRGFTMPRRAFSLLSDSAEAWHLQTIRHDGFCLSCAAAGQAGLTLHPVSVQTLLP